MRRLLARFGVVVGIVVASYASGCTMGGGKSKGRGKSGPSEAETPGADPAAPGVLRVFASQEEFEVYMAALGRAVVDAGGGPTGTGKPGTVDVDFGEEDNQSAPGGEKPTSSKGGGKNGGPVPSTGSGSTDDPDGAIGGANGGDTGGDPGSDSGSGDDGLGSDEDSGGAPGNDGITNNQERDVDEGGIVKNVGDALLVLRRGQLYAVSVAGQAGPVQTDDVPVAADAALAQNVWYDEMLVKGDVVAVVGFRYRVDAETGDAPTVRGAVELALFRLKAGKIERLGLHFFEADDYFSSKNYASRLIGDSLVFYAPFYAFSAVDDELRTHVPRRLSYQGGGRFKAGAPLFGGTDVFRPIERPSDASFHAVVTCDLAEPKDLSCSARAIVGAPEVEHYVSSSSVYLWSERAVYALPLGDGAAVAHRVEGLPLDQLSLKETGKILYAVTQRDEGEPALLALPLAAFDDKAEQELAAHRTALGVREGEVASVVRYGPDALYVGVSGGARHRVVALELGKVAAKSIPIDGPVERFEPLDKGRALAFVAAKDGLGLRVVAGAAGTILAKSSLGGAGIAEGRTHGFFYKPKGDGSGLFGLAVTSGESGESAGEEPVVSGATAPAAQVSYHALAATHAISSLGLVQSSAAGEQESCEESCYEFYGSTRPIFLKDRIFTLLGAELVESRVVGGALEEVGERLVMRKAR